MLETYNLMEDAMLDGPNILDDDVVVELAQKAVTNFLKRSKFTETILVPTLDAPFGATEVNADEYLGGIDEGHFSLCVEVLPPGTFLSEKAWKRLSDWLEAGTIRKSFMINSFKCHILKADMHNDVYVCFTVELIEGKVA